MSEEEWKDIKDYSTNQVWLTEDVRCARAVLNLIQKQDKIINKMAEQFYNLYRNVEVVRDSFDMPFGKFLKSKEEVIEYFKKVVDEDVKEF